MLPIFHYFFLSIQSSYPLPPNFLPFPKLFFLLLIRELSSCFVSLFFLVSHHCPFPLFLLLPFFFPSLSFCPHSSLLLFPSALILLYFSFLLFPFYSPSLSFGTYSSNLLFPSAFFSLSVPYLHAFLLLFPSALILLYFSFLLLLFVFLSLSFLTLFSPSLPSALILLSFSFLHHILLSFFLLSFFSPSLSFLTLFSAYVSFCSHSSLLFPSALILFFPALLLLSFLSSSLPFSSHSYRLLLYFCWTLKGPVRWIRPKLGSFDRNFLKESSRRILAGSISLDSAFK
jgi:hypothetical protein